MFDLAGFWRKWAAPWSDRPAPTYTAATQLFLVVLALAYLAAFASFGFQAPGLIGPNGILPAGLYLQQAAAAGYRYIPTVFWLSSSDFALHAVCVAGAILAVLLTLGYFEKIALVLLFILYLSIVSAGQIFMSYQWDYLLLEAGFLAIFLKPTLVRVWLFQWLLFRLMFESGVVKLVSGDSTWHGLTAMTYHYLTQPLPTPLAWYMYHAPLWFQKFSTAATLAIELAFPFLMLGPRPLKLAAAAATVFLQILILLTGNYAFFNLLAIGLCLFLLDDSVLKRFQTAKPVRENRWVTAALFLLIFPQSCVQLAGILGHGVRIPGPLPRLIAEAGMVNAYGLFANMTTVRAEIAIEGSNDGSHWIEYPFKYKPGDLRRAPPWVEPHQPRLDWQMWFAALGNYQQNPWFLGFIGRLLRNQPEVTRLLAGNPFPGAPPHYIRAVRYEYHFTDAAAKSATGNWWTRELKGLYFPPVSLKQ